MPERNSALAGPELVRHLTAAVQRELTAAETPGAAVALIVDGQVILNSGIGYRDIGRTTTLDHDGQFYIYSVTKTLLAVATLELVGEGRLDLDVPMQEYMPELAVEAPVTVRQLLSHTSGLPDYGGTNEYREALLADPRRPWTPDEFLEQTLRRGLIFAPGRGWSYSNIGFLVLRLLVEGVTGNSMREVLRQRIFESLGLRHTFVAETIEDAHLLTSGYSKLFSAGDSPEDVTPFYHPGWVSHGVVVSTALDLASIFEALFTGRLLSPAQFASMLDPMHVPAQHPLFRQPSYGLGVMIDPVSPYGLVAGHGGGGPGYSAAALHFPHIKGHRATIVALANCDRDDLAMGISFALAGVLTNSQSTEP